MKHALVVLTAAIGFYGVLPAPTARAADPATGSSALGAQFFEQRVYTTAPGKLPLLHKRFREHTNELFVRHGMHLIAYWTPADKDDMLIYVLAYPSREAREASWKAFMDDPEWQRVWAASKEEAGGAIVTNVASTFMVPTDYSPIR